VNAPQADESGSKNGDQKHLNRGPLANASGDLPTSDPAVEGPALSQSLESASQGSSEQSQAPRRKRRAAVRLSRVDAERLARGEIASPEEALHLNDLRETRSLQREEPIVSPRDANERRLLGDRPPHFGSL